MRARESVSVVCDTSFFILITDTHTCVREERRVIYDGALRSDAERKNKVCEGRMRENKISDTCNGTRNRV